MGNKILKDFVKKHKFSYIIGIIFMLLSSYIQTLFPGILGNTIDILKKSNFNDHAVIKNIFYILLIAVGTFVCTYAWRNLVIGNSRKLECHLREKLFDHMQKLSASFYNKNKTGDLLAYAINDIGAVRMTLGPATAMSINGAVVCTISIYSMIRNIDWRLTLMSLLPIPFIVIGMLKIGQIVQIRFKKVQKNFAAISDRVQENINGIRVIKSYVQEDSELNDFQVLNNKMVDSNLSMVKISSYLSPLIEICFSISFAANLIIGGNMVLKGKISLGNFIAFNTYLTMIMQPVISIGRVITILQRGTASLKRLNEIFDTAPEIVDGKKNLCSHIKGRIQINDLNFKYPGTDKYALKNINLSLAQGQTLGIVGRTGSGKTTLANILLKLYNIDDNTVLIDGHDLNEYNLKFLRNGFGYVPQDNFLFSASILDNITFFKNCYTNDEIISSTKNSCIYDKIIDFPNGFKTILGERGVNLSGGQKQRISIARAVIKDPSILILDDALSAVDNITEKEIIHNLKNIRKNKTTIIISHRLSAVEGADKIIVMEHGRIQEKGTHKELMSKGGLYYEICEEQFKDKK